MGYLDIDYDANKECIGDINLITTTEVLDFFNQNLPSEAEVDQMTTASPVNCAMRCSHCGMQCIKKSYIRHKEHYNKTDCNHAQANRFPTEEKYLCDQYHYRLRDRYKCTQCVTEGVSPEHANVTASAFNKWVLISGKWYGCAHPDPLRNHGYLAHGISLRNFGTSSAFMQKVITKKEHFFADKDK